MLQVNARFRIGYSKTLFETLWKKENYALLIIIGNQACHNQLACIMRPLYTFLMSHFITCCLQYVINLDLFLSWGPVWVLDWVTGFWTKIGPKLRHNKLFIPCNLFLQYKVVLVVSTALLRSNVSLTCIEARMKMFRNIIMHSCTKTRFPMLLAFYVWISVSADFSISRDSWY